IQIKNTRETRAMARVFKYRQELCSDMSGLKAVGRHHFFGGIRHSRSSCHKDFFKLMNLSLTTMVRESLLRTFALGHTFSADEKLFFTKTTSKDEGIGLIHERLFSCANQLCQFVLEETAYRARILDNPEFEGLELLFVGHGHLLDGVISTPSKLIFHQLFHTLLMGRQLQRKQQDRKMLVRLERCHDLTPVLFTRATPAQVSAANCTKVPIICKKKPPPGWLFGIQVPNLRYHRRNGLGLLALGRRWTRPTWRVRQRSELQFH